MNHHSDSNVAHYNKGGGGLLAQVVQQIYFPVRLIFFLAFLGGLFFAAVFLAAAFFTDAFLTAFLAATFFAAFFGAILLAAFFIAFWGANFFTAFLMGIFLAAFFAGAFLGAFLGAMPFTAVFAGAFFRVSVTVFTAEITAVLTAPATSDTAAKPYPIANPALSSIVSSAIFRSLIFDLECRHELYMATRNGLLAKNGLFRKFSIATHPELVSLVKSASVYQSAVDGVERTLSFRLSV